MHTSNSHLLISNKKKTNSVVVRKMSRKSCVWIAVLVLVLAATANADTLCADAITRLLPCQSFLVGTSSSITFPCCSGASSVEKLVGSDQAKLKTVCKCLKQAAIEMGVNTERAKQIPQLCSISTPIPLDPNVDCNSI